MTSVRTDVFEFLRELARRPEPFGEYTARELWTDPHTARQMLRCHLDETMDAASRNRGFIGRSAAWMASHFGLGPGSAVLDLGCGPGLYAQRLAAAGAAVTGVDFSASSLQYARDAATRAGLAVDYVEADYLAFETDRRFDLIIMIMCDFCALSPEQRGTVLRRCRAMLAPGGAVALDVYSPRMFEARREETVCAPRLLDGFWSPDEYYGILDVFKYDDRRLVLERYTIVERDRIRQVFNWFQCFTPDELERESASAGLRIVERLGDVAGSAFDPEGSEFAIVAAARDEA